ncbi:MAG: protein kinase, partial [Rhodothermaceae bacterium]|nr:protein kinase [Rhodothermaceae bacterium]
MIGSQINQYQILDALGEGGMGVVYLAEDTRLQRKVALKFVTNTFINSGEEIVRFQREARAAARLNHPNICTVYELGETEDKTFIAMEYVKGVTLKERMRQGNISEDEIRNWLEQIAKGLGTAHEEGIIHRDIKPANIMITDKGLIKIMDFGIAKLVEGETELTQANSTIGTIAYMSPEQARGEAIDQRTDIWSVGVILYELATGQRPFTGAFREAVMYAMIHEEPVPVKELNHGVSDELDSIINKCLERDREKRCGSLEEVLATLVGRAVDTVKASGAIKVVDKLDEVTTVQPHLARGETSSDRWTLLGSKKLKRIAVGIVVMLGILALMPGIRSQLTGVGKSEGLPSAMHLAVLPFSTFTDEPKERAFSNGLAHLVASNLMQFGASQEDMWIIPVREVLSQEITSARDARESFGVNLVVSGTIVNSGEDMQITLDLTDALSLRLVHSETIQLTGTDPKAIQEQVVVTMGLMLGLEAPENSDLLLAGQTGDPEAHKLYIQGQGFIQQFQVEENIDEAIRLFEEAIALDSTYVLAHAAAGLAYSRKFNFTNEVSAIESAREHVERASKLNDNLVEVWNARARVYFDSGDRPAAVEAAEHARQIDPENYDANRVAAAAYTLSGNLKRAEELILKCISLQPSYWDPYNTYFYILRFENRNEEAMAQLQKVIELAPGNAWAYNNLAGLHLTEGDTASARVAYQQSLDLDPKAFTYFTLGVLADSTRNYEEAVENYTKAIEMEEENSR